MNPYHYIVSFAKGVGGIIRDASLILRPNFNDMANLSLTSPSNGSAVFNGSSDYVQTPTPFSNTQHTICAWVYFDDTSGSNVIFDNRDANDDGVRLLQSAGILTYQLNAVDRSTSVSASKWYYVSASYNGTTQNLFVDGSLIASGTTTQTISTTTNALIGRQSYAAVSYMNGNIANVAVWNRALTSDEINSIMWKRYDLLTAGESTGLVAWYALDNITGTDVPDSTGNYNGTAY
jgi:hypothetical protein